MQQLLAAPSTFFIGLGALGVVATLIMSILWREVRFLAAPCLGFSGLWICVGIDTWWHLLTWW